MELSTPSKDLLEQLEPFTSLNPAVVLPRMPHLRKLAARVPANDAHRFVTFTDTLFTQFLNAPWKQKANSIIAEFSRHLDQAGKRLAERGDVPHTPSHGPSPHSVALATARTFTAIEWCKLVNEAAVPQGLTKSVDAVIERNRITGTVLQPMLELLHIIDADKAFAWELDFLETQRGTLDPDAVRDVLRTWRTAESIPVNAVKWILEWCSDEDLRRQWPAVSQEADRNLRRHALQRWAAKHEHTRHPRLKTLRTLANRRPQPHKQLARWEHNAIRDIGENILAFIGFAQHARQNKSNGHPDWNAQALIRELQRLNTLFVPVLLLADTLLAEPDGTYTLALAILGMPHAELEAFRQKILDNTETLIRNQFIRAMQEGHSPEHAIRRFSLGDSQLRAHVLAQLELLTREFHSWTDREKAVQALAPHVASYRETKLLPKELTRRYRLLMQALHPDQLNRLIGTDAVSALGDTTPLAELGSSAADARRYLQKRRALDTSVDDMMSATQDFEKSIRLRRLHAARRLLLTGPGQPRTPPPPRSQTGHQP